jgi:hypothetical protein
MNSFTFQSKDQYIFVIEIIVNKSSSEIFINDERYDEFFNKNNENDKKNEKDEDNNDN